MLIYAEKKTESDVLAQYADQVTSGDLSNREGGAARLYFVSLFGNSFIRGTADAVNASLNYGFSAR